MDGVDGMLEQENEGLRERVSTLEKKVRQQEDEIVCLKSALADVIRKITVIENTRVTANGGLPNKPSIKSPHRSLPSKDSPRKSRGGSADLPSRSRSGVTPSKAVPRTPASGTSIKKWPSVPSSGLEVNGQNINRLGGSMTNLQHRPLSSLRISRESTFNNDEGCVRMYLRGRAINLYAPTNLQDYDINQLGQPPQEKLKLEWVYGYRGRDARSNLYLLPTGEIIYFVAGVVVLYNVDEQMQRHYLGHTDDVKCLALHPDKITIASGQVAGHDKKEGKPHIRIWDSVSLNTLKIIGVGDFDRAVACVAFSKVDGGQFLAAIDEANEHVLSVWDWQKGEKGHKITETKSSTEPVLACEYHPCDKNIIVSCGKSQILFWTLDNGALTKKSGLFEKNEKPKYVTCLAFAENGDAITGDSNGNVFIWARGSNRVSQAITDAHEGPVFTICVLNDGMLLSGGGKDRKIIQWDSSYKKTGHNIQLPDNYGAVRMISQGKGNMVLVGTTKNIILHGTMDFKFSPITQGHSDEIWGMTTHPSQHQFLSCGYDKQIYVWDTMAHSVIWQKDLPEHAHCVSLHPDGNLAVIGSQTSRWLVLDMATREIIATHTDGSEQIECVAFSPDGKQLALGSRDNFIYLHQVSEDGRKYQKIGRCSGHSSFVTHIDWSVDGLYLQSNSGDYEILYWNAATCRQISYAANMKDVQWATQTCTLGFNVCGIWPEGADGTDVNSCCRSHKDHLVASGDDFGKVNLYRYPCCQPKAIPNAYPGHSSHVTNVQFLRDDSRLLSAGGKDTAIMQWEII